MCLTTYLKKLQTQRLLLSDYIEIINDVDKSFETLRGQTGLKMQSKLKQVLEKNTGLSLLKKISCILLGIRDIEELDGFPDDISSSDVPYFKFATITSVDIERSFSTYKTFLTNNRRSFKFENIHKHIKIQCNFQGIN